MIAIFNHQNKKQKRMKKIEIILTRYRIEVKRGDNNYYIFFLCQTHINTPPWPMAMESSFLLGNGCECIVY